MRKLIPLTAVVLAAAVLVLTGCGTNNTVTRTVRVAPTPAVACPPGQSFMGCATPPSFGLARREAVPAGALIPDVSSFQGTVGWGSVRAWQLAHRWTPAGIFKMGEFVADPFARTNAAALHKLRMVAIGYWFIRNTGCAHEADQIIAAARALGIRVVVFDMEVPEAAAYASAGCLTGPVLTAGLIPVIYTGPGTWPGGPAVSLPGWIATYGPSHAACLAFTCHLVAWQFTDGHFGSNVFVPGIGFDDVSVDMGLLALAKPPAPAPPRLVCFGPHAHVRARTCMRVRVQVARWQRAEAASAKHVEPTARQLAAHRCERPYRRHVCVQLGRAERVFVQRARYFAGRAAATIRTHS